MIRSLLGFDQSKSAGHAIVRAAVLVSFGLLLIDLLSSQGNSPLREWERPVLYWWTIVAISALPFVAILAWALRGRANERLALVVDACFALAWTGAYVLVGLYVAHRFVL